MGTCIYVYKGQKTTSSIFLWEFFHFVIQHLSLAWNFSTQAMLAYLDRELSAICLSLPPISSTLGLQAFAIIAGFLLGF